MTVRVFWAPSLSESILATEGGLFADLALMMGLYSVLSRLWWRAVMWMGKGGEKASISLMVSHIITMSSSTSSLQSADHPSGSINKPHLPRCYMYASY